MINYCYIAANQPNQPLNTIAVLQAMGKLAGKQEVLNQLQFTSVEEVKIAIANRMALMGARRLVIEPPVCWGRDALEIARILKIPIRICRLRLSCKTTPTVLLRAFAEMKKCAGEDLISYSMASPDGVIQEIAHSESQDGQSCKVGAMAILGSTEGDRGEKVVVLECNIDDCTGEQLAFAMELLLSHGARDVFFTPITMKKSRPAVILSVICLPHHREVLSMIMFKHTSTIGIRGYIADRWIMDREQKVVSTPWGNIEVKLCQYGDVKKTSVEYESAKKAAIENDCSVETIIRGTLKMILS